MAKLDTIYIHQLKANAIIGVYDFEKIKPQPLFLDIKMKVDLRSAGKSDDLSETIDYAKVAEQVLNHIENTQYELLETLAENLCQQLLATYPSLQKITFKLSKPEAVPQAQTVGIKITRRR